MHTQSKALKYDSVQWTVWVSAESLLFAGWKIPETAESSFCPQVRAAPRTCYFNKQLPSFTILSLIVFLLPFLLSFAEQSELNKRLVLGCSHLPLCCPWPQPTSRVIKTQPCYFYSVNKNQLQSSLVPNQLPSQTFTERTDHVRKQPSVQPLVGHKCKVWYCDATRTKVILLTYII